MISTTIIQTEFKQRREKKNWRFRRWFFRWRRQGEPPIFHVSVFDDERFYPGNIENWLVGGMKDVQEGTMVDSSGLELRQMNGVWVS